jgi:dTDP-4-dehydrorhamnose 3,5-epimerase
MADIAGVVFRPLQQIIDERGKIMHMLKATDVWFKQFGEIYFSCAWPGAVKGWHKHHSMTLNMAVISGHAKFCCYDAREDSRTWREINTFYLGEDAYGLLTIPPNVWSGYIAYGDKLVVVANCATEPHRKDEITYWPHDEFPYSQPVIPFEWSHPYG